MCGRFHLTRAPEDVAALFRLDEPPEVLRPRYNIAPGQPVAAVGLKPGGVRRGLALLTWGLVPGGSSTARPKVRPINAKAETVASLPMFAASFRARRCLIPADGFYEWAAEGGKKVPYRFRLASGRPFAFAGLWDVWKGEGHPPLVSCAVITVPANDLVRPFHDRMPAILLPDRFDRWLDSGTSEAERLSLLAPLPAELMDATRVSPAVNKVANDGPECLTPAA